MVSVITKGWDLIAAINQQTLNALLASAFSEGIIPPSVAENLDLGPLGTAQVTVNITTPTVDLNPVQTQGQSGLVGLTFPITGGSITINNTPTSIPAGSLEVIAALKYVTVDFSAGTSDRLSLDFSSPLTVYNVIINEPNWPQEFVNFISTTLRQYLQGLTPATIYLGSVNFPSAATPLAPVGNADFAIQTASDPSQNSLLLLMTTASGVQPSGPSAVDFSTSPPLIPSNQQSALYVSNRALIQEIIVPQLASSLDTTPSSFSIQGDVSTPYTATFNGDYDFGGDYDPHLTNISVSVNDNQQVQGAYTVDAHPLFNAGKVYYVEVDGNIFISINLNGQVISFNTTSDKGSGSIKANAAGWVIVVAAIIASFGTLGAFIGIVLAIVVPVLITQLKFPISLPPSLLAGIGQALGSFTWPAQQSFPLTGIQLPGDLVFFGTPKI